MPGSLMLNRIKRLLNEWGEFMLGSVFFLAGYIGIAIYASRYVGGIFGLPSLKIGIPFPYSLAFLAIMVVFIFIGFALIIDDLSKVF